MKNTSLILTASVVTLFGIIAVSGDAVAQTPSSGIITYPTYPGSGISSCCYLTSKTDISRDSFSTIHVWKLQTPGTFALDSTKFTISFARRGLSAEADGAFTVFNLANVSYDLMYDGKWVANAVSLDTRMDAGILRAIDMQKSGLLK
jgi:hypothetical protein